MFSEKDRQWLFLQMQDAGVDTGSYDDFKKSLNNQEDRDWYYRKSLDLGLDVGSDKDFYDMMVEEQAPASNVPAVNTESKTVAKPQATGQQQGVFGRLRDIVANGVQSVMPKKNPVGKPQGTPANQGTGEFASSLPTVGQMKKNAISRMRNPIMTQPTILNQPKIAEQGVVSRVDDKGNVTQEWGEKPKGDTGFEHYVDEEGNYAGSQYVGQEGSLYRRQQEYQQATERPMTDDDIISYADQIDKDFGKAYKRDRENNASQFYGTAGYREMGKHLLSAETNDLAAAKAQMDEARSIVEAARRAKGDRNAFLGFFQDYFVSLWDKLLDFDTWDFGMKSAEEAQRVRMTLDKYDRGEKLTKSEEQLLNAVSMNTAAKMYYGSEQGMGNTVGSTVGEMIPFMIQMAISPESGWGKLASSKTFQKLANWAGKSMMKRAAARGLQGLTRLATDIGAGYVMATNVGAGRTIADMERRMTGNVDVDPVKFKYAGREKGDDAVTAAAKALTSQAIEYQSEMVGEYFKPLLGMVGKGVTRGIMKGGNETLKNFLNMGVQAYDRLGKTKMAEFFRQLNSLTHYDGAVGEYLEEVVGNIENATSVGDMNFGTGDNGVFNLKDNVTTFLSVAVPGVAQAAMTRTADWGTRAYKSKKDKEGKDVFGEDVWNIFKEDIDKLKLDATRPDEIADEFAKIVNNVKPESEEELKALRGYFDACMVEQAVGMGQQMADENGKADVQDMIEGATERGRELGTEEGLQGDAANEAKRMLDYERERLSEIATDDMITALDVDPVGTLDFIQKSEDWTAEEKQAAMDYVNAKVTYDGMIGQVRDDIDSRVKANDAVIDSRVNRNDGMIHPATMKDSDAPAYIVSGNVVMTDDGTSVDREKSDKDIIVMNTETGKVEFQSIDDVMSVDEALNPDELKAESDAAIREEYATKASESIEGVLPFNVGDEYEVMDNYGSQHTVSVVPVPADMVLDEREVLVSIDGEEPVALNKEYVQSTADNMKNAELLQKLEAQSLAELEQIEQDEEGATAYRLNDGVTLRTEDGLVNGTIVGEEDADGNITVQVDKPVNGASVFTISRESLDGMNDGLLKKQEEEENAATMSQQSGQEEEVKSEDDVMVERLLGRDEKSAGRFIKNNVDELEKQLTAARKKESKATDLDTFEKETAEYDAEVQRLEAELERWRNISNRVRETRVATVKEAADDAIAQKKVEELGEPLTLREWIMRSLYNRGYKMVWGDDPKSATRGLASHLGVKGSQKETKDRLWMMDKRDKGALYPEEVAEQMLRGYADDMGWTGTDGDWNVNSQDVLNELLDVVRSYGKRSDLGNAIVAEHEKVSNESMRQQREEEEYLKENFARDMGFTSYDEYDAYESAAEQGTNQAGGTDGSVVVSETGQAGSEGNAAGNEGQGSIQEAGSESGSNLPQGEGVGQSVVAPSEQLKPTDLRDAVKPDTAELGADEAKAKAKGGFLDAIRALYSKGKEYASQLYQRTFFDVAKTPDFMKKLGLTGDKFTIRYGVLSRHMGKDAEHALPVEVWEQLPDALQDPFAITRYYEDEEKKNQKGYRLYTAIRLPNGSYVVVGAEVKNSGRDLEVNAIDTVFGRDTGVGSKEDLIYTSTKITPEQQALLDGHNPHQYPAEREQGGEDNTLDNTTDTGKTSERGKRNDTATPQSTVSGGKGTEVFNNKQENQQEILNQPSYSSKKDWEIYNGKTNKEISDIQYKKAEEVLKGLKDAGYNDFYISRSITNFGVSTYIQGMYGLKFRISDHSVTSNARIQDEEFFGLQTPISFFLDIVKDASNKAKERSKAIDERIEKERLLDEKWERIKHRFDGLGFKINNRTYQDFDKFSSNKNRTNIIQIPLDKGAFKYEWTEPKDAYTSDKPSYEWLERFDEPEIGQKQTIQGLENYEPDEVLNAIRGDVEIALDEAGLDDVVIKDMAIIGSRMRGDAEEDSDLDVLLEYEGDISEDGLFNILNDTPIEIEGIKVDINPITKGKSGTIAEFMKRNEGYKKTSTPEQIEAEEQSVNTNPTEGQKKAGNYKMGHIKVDGFDVTIENPKGSVRRGTDASGKKWEQKMNNTYGYIRGTEGVDGDHIDVFLSDDPTQGDVFVVDQVNKDGSFDEHKVMYGFPDMESARQAYLSNYEEGWQGLGAITPVSKEEFKKWVDSSHRKTKPFAEYSSVKTLGDVQVGEGNNETAGEELEKTSQGYHVGDQFDIIDDTGRDTQCRIVDIDDDGNLKLYIGWHGNNRNVTVSPSTLDLFRERKVDDNTRKELKSFIENAVDDDDVTFLNKIANYELAELYRLYVEWGMLENNPESGNAQEAFDKLDDYIDTLRKEYPVRKQEKKVEKAATVTQQSGQVKEPKRLVSDARMEELKERLRKKMLGQLNMGVDPEILALGAELAVGHIERGLTKFAAYAKAMIEDLGDAIRPYLKSFYNAVRDMPEAESYVDQMDGYDDVRVFDLANFDKNVVDAMATAEEIVEEQEAERQAKEAKGKIVKAKSKKKGKNVKPSLAMMGDLFGGESATEAQQTEPAKPKLDKKDYRTYMTKEAKEYFAKDPRFAKSKHKELNYITAAVWDGVVIPIEDLKKIPELVAAQKRNDTLSAQPPLQLSEEEMDRYARRLLDAEHGSAVFEDGKIRKVDGHEDFSGAVEQKRKAYVVIGRPAGGKSSVFANSLSYENKARIVDSDVVKEWLDGFDGGFGAGYVQDMSAKIAERALDIAVQNGDNIVLPRIGGKSVMIMSAALRAMGYDVQLYLNDVVPSTSYMRSSSRFAMTGRYLSLDYLTSIKGKPNETFIKFAKKSIGDYINECTEEEIQKLRDRLESMAGRQRGDLLRALYGWLDAGRRGKRDGSVQSDVGRSNDDGTSTRIDLNAPMFSYAEWKSNDVAFGEKPKEIWNSASGKELPQNTNENDSTSARTNKQGSGRVSSGEPDDSTPAVSKRVDDNIPQRRTVGQGDSGVQGRGKEGEGRKEELGGTQRQSGGIQQLETPQNPKNLRNNHAERGKDYAPKGVDARIEANIKAIELMQQLIESGEQATPEQMAVLRKFSGWGGLGKAFESFTAYTNGKPTPMYLKDLLGDEAYQQAVMSRNSAYYTPASVIDAMWDIARAMGFKGGKLLEGSAGIGNILGLMPKDMSVRSDIQAVEIDPTTGNILSLLYPDAQVDIQGFEATPVENGSVDLAITNVPFVTGLRVMDTTGDKDLSKKFHDIHDFCIAKNVRKLKDGGIGIFITSSGTLDNSAKLREWIVNEGGADVVGAFRLNNETFGGTGATSDIIVIRKRVNGQKSPYAIDVLTTTGERTAEYDTGETKRVKGEDVPVVKELSMDYNKYLVEHPENMGGEMFFGFEKGDTFRPTSKALYPVKGKNQAEMLDEWTKSFEGKDWGEAATVSQQTEQSNVYEDLGNDVKEGSMVVSNGKLCVAQRGKAVPLAVNDNKVKGHTKVECFNAYKGIKDALADVLDYQTSHEDNEGLEPLLKKLNKAYDDFVKTYGHLHKNTAISFLKNDVDFSNILALEKFSEKGDVKMGKRIQEFGKTDVFNQRVVEKDKEPEPKNVQDAIIASLYLHGRIDLPWIAATLSQHSEQPMTEEEIKDEIVKDGLGFENPLTRQMEVSYEYLSGNVREKLQQAIENNGDGRYDANIKALEKVVPMNIPAHLIDFSIGSSWIDPKLYEEYVREKTDVDVTFTPVGGTWYMKAPSWVNEQKNRAMGVVSDMLHKTIMGTQLIEAAMQNKTITVSETRKKWDGSTETITDKEATQACANKIDEIRQDFKEWARAKMQSDPVMSEQMERVYNDMFNNYVPKAIPDEFVPDYFNGATHSIKLNPHQSKAAIRGTTQPLLLAHEVGSGKTFTLITTAMEMRRLGTAKKPMIVVQNATVGQFVEEAKHLYPNAKILTIEEADRTPEGRKNFYAKIKYNDWDMIVVPQSVLERIPDSEERQMKFVHDKIEEKLLVLEQMKDADPNGQSMIVRQAEKEIEKLEDELASLSSSIVEKRRERDEKKAAVTRQNAEVKALEMLDRETDDVENFDDMGIDALLVDEAHEYKHLGFATAMQRGVKGIDPSYSKKAQGVFLKTQAVLEKNNGKNVIFATGTPISNTAAEIWTFMRYLMPADVMKDYGIYYFDDFVRNFGNLTQMLEFTTSGKFKENNRFAGYVNLPELARIWSGVADIVLNKDVEELRKSKGEESKIPDMEGGQAQDIYLPQTKALRSVMKYVKRELDRYDKMSGKEKKENSHIPLTMYGIAKAAAVDARLVVDDAADEPQSKTNEAVRQTLKSLEETKSYKGTVALFADNYQNKHSSFNLYEDIRKKLIEAGVPAEQIVIIKSGMSVKKKLEIFDAVNRGDIRVIMGSTFTLGTGVNIQERLHTLIHLDAPNRPMDYTQRNGRILRQGNIHKQMNKPVRVLRFGVEDSLDVTAYQRLKTKGAIADSIMNGKKMMENSMENRALEEEEDVFGDTVAQLSGSEYAMLKNQAEKDVRKYEAKKKQYEADQTYCHNEIPRLEAEIKNLNARIKEDKKALDRVKGLKGQTITVGKQKFDSVDAMSDFIKDYNKKIKETEMELRENPSTDAKRRQLTVNIDGIDFVFTTEQAVETKNEQGTLFTAVRRKMTYSCEALGLEDVPVKQSLLREGLEDIMQNVITGKDFREDEERAATVLQNRERALEQVKERFGKPFEFTDELKKAHERYDEYAELMKKEMEEKEKKYAEMDEDVDEAAGVVDAEEAEEEAEEVLFREVEEEETIDWLENQPKVKVYRSMVMKDGKLYPPMSSKEADGKQLRQPSEIGKWEESEEAPEKAVLKNGKWVFPLRKDNGKMLYAAYNPYLHTSRTMLNDQFSEAQDRENLVVVEMEVPVSELTSGYQAEKAKDSVGAKQWKAGVIQGQLNGTREVILTRWAKPVRVVPVGEVADNIMKQLDGQVDVMPTNVVTPELRKALEKNGMKFVETDNRGKIKKGEYAGRTWASVYGKNGKEDLLREAGIEVKEKPQYVSKRRYTKKQEEAAIRRATERFYGLVDKVTVFATGDDYLATLKRKPTEQNMRKARSKGWYDPITNKIFIIANNNDSYTDTVKTLLHEGVAHFGLREMVGKERFNQFLDDVYAAADEEIRRQIVALARDKYDWDFRKATEEFMAQTAEEMDFENTDNPETFRNTLQAWWRKIKDLFLQMMGNLGFGEYYGDEIGINEIKYLLWRSWKNMTEPGTYKNPWDVFAEAEDVVMQNKLKVGRYEKMSEQERKVAENVEEPATTGFENETMNEWLAFEKRVPKMSDEELLGYIEAQDADNPYHSSVFDEYDERHRDEYLRRMDFYKEELDNLFESYRDPDEALYHIDGEMRDSVEDRWYSGGYGTEDRTALMAQLDAINEWLNEYYYKQDAEENGMVRESEPDSFAKFRAKNKDVQLENLKGDGLHNEDEYYLHGKLPQFFFGIPKGSSLRYSSCDIVSTKDDEISASHDSYGNIRVEVPESMLKGDGDVKTLNLSAIRDAVLDEIEKMDVSLYRDGEDKAIARYTYERMVTSAANQFTEAVQDSMLSLKNLYMAILGAEGDKVSIEEVKGYENAYLAENRMHSASEAQVKAWHNAFMKPLIAEMYKLTNNDPVERRMLADYMMAKHGLERNEVMAERDFKRYQEENPKGTKTIGNFRSRDYAGLTALTGENRVVDAEGMAAQMVEEYERTHDTTELWKRVNAATKSSLEKTYKSGMLDRERYEQIRDMFKYYIPLQGFDEKVASDVYAYFGNDGTRSYGTPIRGARGRKSLADDPIATIEMNGEAAIRQGNRNLMKQNFLNFVLNHPSDLVSVSDVWLRYNDATDEWEQYFDADLREDDSPDEIERKMREFEERMEQLAENDPDHYRRGTEYPNIPYRVLDKNQRQQHQVLVRRNGKDYVLTINGNPRAAQALNGLTNPDVFTEGVFGKAMNIGQQLNRQLSLLYTTRNPEFVLSNYLRDAIYSNSMVWVKESPQYAIRFHKNFGLMNPVFLGKMFAEWESGALAQKVAAMPKTGTLSEMDRLRKMFLDFMENGGETGWTNLRDIEKHKRDLEKELKQEGNTSRKAWKALSGCFDLMNRAVENNARFAAYVTSREMGRSVERSIWDAKEISVNFNKKGSGDKFLTATGQTRLGKLGSVLGGLGRGLYVFWNASTQGLNNIAKASKRHPFKAASVILAGQFMMGVLMPLVSDMLCNMVDGGDGDDDDNKDSYYNLPEYIRRSNICFRWTREMPWITIPLPIEFRAVYGLGELATGTLTGKERYTGEEFAKQFVSQLSQVLPLDFMEGGGGWHAFVPSSVKPMVEAMDNKSWSGLPIYRDNKYTPYKPQWTRAYASANQYIVEATKWLNDVTGGDEVAQGWIDWNPAAIEYMLEGYLGGLFTVYDRLQKTAQIMFGDREFDWRDVLFASRVLKHGDERTQARKVKNEYFDLKEEYEKTKSRLNGYKKIADSGREDALAYAERIDFLHNSKEYLHYEIMDYYTRILDAYSKLGKDAEGEEKKRIEAEENAVRDECVELIHAIDAGKDIDVDAAIESMLERMLDSEDEKISRAAENGLKRFDKRDVEEEEE